MDFSDYTKNHKCYDNSNKTVLGKFKDEENGKIIEEVICLKPKMYAIKTGDEIHKKAKGIPTNKLNKNLDLKKYKETLNGSKLEHIQYQAFRSTKHEIYTISQSKTALSKYDDKRFWITNTSSLAYGHVNIK